MSGGIDDEVATKPTSAADYKELGNKAFADKDFNAAIQHYTKAIQLEPTNHVFFSNRSASYAGLKEWEKSMQDAKECIRLDPEFIKGYYRLATAQLEMKNFDAAEATIKQGMTLDANNSQLSRTLRSIKQARKLASAAAAAASSSASSPSILGGNRQLDTATARELHDLRVQHNKTAREYQTVQANLTKAQREEKMYNLTFEELKERPSAKYYRSVGKVFMQSSQPQIFEHLESNINSQQKKQQELTGKMEYLEKRLKSQQLNMKELTSS
ncbi:TPR repeat-containing serine/threonine protein kinase [Nitzschia inconspicua]|uniref:Hsp70-Hsp90 organising protein n=1 Tax=Nitzschia inconspicua TaxID=303405 RepID=A0A9K3L9W2_9STRA|nr:TPR repeat-containing serine/threonine protein kinase [Nitzschia inconspicua]